MNNDKDEETEYISKSQMKRDMLALQELGEKLVALNSDQLSQLELPEDLLSALNQAQAIKKHGARRRQLQYIGRLMRSADAENIQQQYDTVTQQSRESINELHKTERWRERLLDEGDQALTDFINTYPDADRQQLRTLVRSAVQERKDNKPPKFYRKIFQFIKQHVHS